MITFIAVHRDRILSPCMRPALLGPCYKTGPSPSLTKGGLPATPSLLRPGTRRGPSQLREGTPAARPAFSCLWPPFTRLLAPVPGFALPHCRLHGQGRGSMPSTRTGPSLGARGSGSGRQKRGQQPTVNGQARHPNPPFTPRPYSSTPAELRRQVRRTRLDGLLALLPECFAQFPHGTYMLSGS